MPYRHEKNKCGSPLWRPRITLKALSAHSLEQSSDRRLNILGCEEGQSVLKAEVFHVAACQMLKAIYLTPEDKLLENLQIH